MDDTRKVKKALIPAAGKGTRMLHLADNTPKELLSVGGKPVIQYVIEEALASEIEEIAVVLHPDKTMIRTFIENHNWKKKIQFHYLDQPLRKGLGDAVLMAKKIFPDDPFAVLLGDTIIETKEYPLTFQLCRIFAFSRQSVVALQEVETSMVSRYGIAGAEQTIMPSVYKLLDVIEKPEPGKAPSNLAFSSRYIFTPAIFDALEKTKPGHKNEIQLTDAMRILMHSQKIFGLKYEGSRHDIGNPEDYEKAKRYFDNKA